MLQIGSGVIRERAYDGTGCTNMSWTQMTFPKHVGVKWTRTINRESASQKAHSSYMLQFGPSGKIPERYTTPELYAVASRAETGVTTRSEPTNSTSNEGSWRKCDTQLRRS